MQDLVNIVSIIFAIYAELTFAHRVHFHRSYSTGFTGVHGRVPAQRRPARMCFGLQVPPVTTHHDATTGERLVSSKSRARPTFRKLSSCSPAA